MRTAYAAFSDRTAAVGADTANGKHPPTDVGKHYGAARDLDLPQRPRLDG